MRLPKGHKVWVELPQTQHYITSLINDRSKYYLWKLNGNKLEKVATANNPLKLEKYIAV